MLCLVSPNQVVPKDHPLRQIKPIADAALRELSEDFDAMYSKCGRSSVPPETLLKSMLLIAFYSVRSERLFCDQLGYNYLFRWFVDMDMVKEPFDHSAFSHNRDRLLEHHAAQKFLYMVVLQAKELGLMSSEHFSVDGTLIEAWASMKSFQPKDQDDDDQDNNGWSDFRGQKRKNDTHESKTDPEAKLMRKGKGREAKLSYSGHVLMENRNGLIVDARLEYATGRAEREAALEMVKESIPGGGRVTLGADKGYDTKDFVADLRENNVTPHVASKQRSAIDHRTTRHRGYEISQTVRRRVEQVFGWLKTVAGLRKTRYRGRERNRLAFYMAAAAYNLIRLGKMTPIPA